MIREWWEASLSRKSNLNSNKRPLQRCWRTVSDFCLFEINEENVKIRYLLFLINFWISLTKFFRIPRQQHASRRSQSPDHLLRFVSSTRAAVRFAVQPDIRESGFPVSPRQHHAQFTESHRPPHAKPLLAIYCNSPGPFWTQPLISD